MTNAELADRTLTAVAAASHLAVPVPPCCNTSRLRWVATGCTGCVLSQPGALSCNLSCDVATGRAALHQVPELLARIQAFAAAHPALMVDESA